jgi:prepilin-type N-terminal cleavage/methylation domain-containing protein
MQRSSRSQRGFTLLEMAVVLVIISAVLGVVMAGGIGMARSSMVAGTRAKQGQIKDAMLSYLRSNQRLPCPDTDIPPDGRENRTGGVTTACTANWGALPYLDLNVPKDLVTDSWSNLMTYVVSNNVAEAIQDWTLTAKFSGRSQDYLVVDAGPSGQSKATIVLLSHGAGGEGARNVDGVASGVEGSPEEKANAAGCVDGGNPPKCFVRELSDTFDDVVLAITREDLLRPLFAQGVLLSPEAQFAKDCADIKTQLVSSGLSDRKTCGPIMSNHCYPLADPKPFVDVDGKTILLNKSAPPAEITADTQDAPAYTYESSVGLKCVITRGDLKAVFALTGL